MYHPPFMDTATSQRKEGLKHSIQAIISYVQRAGGRTAAGGPGP